MRMGLLVLLLCLNALAGAHFCSVQQTDQDMAEAIELMIQKAHQAVLSPTRKVVTYSANTVDNMHWSMALEKSALALEAFLEQPLPFESEPLRVCLFYEEDVQREDILRFQSYTKTGLNQKLVLFNPGLLNEEDVHAAACALLLNRYVIAAQPPLQRHAQLGQAPSWLVLGCIGNTRTDLKKFARQYMMEQWRREHLFPIDRLTDENDFPDDWNRGMVCCAALIWLKSFPRFSEVLTEIFTCTAKGRAFAVHDLIAFHQNLHEPHDLRIHWSLAVAGFQHILFNEALSVHQLVTEFKQRLTVFPEEYGIMVGRNVLSPMTIRELIAFRREPWFSQLRQRLTHAFRQMLVITDPELKQIVEQYVVLLEAMDDIGWDEDRDLNEKKKTKILIEQWRQAHDRLEALERKTTAWKTYLDRMEQGETAAAAAPEPKLPKVDPLPEAKPLPPAQEEAIRQYLDALEAMMK